MILTKIQETLKIKKIYKALKKNINSWEQQILNQMHKQILIVLKILHLVMNYELESSCNIIIGEIDCI